MKPLKVTFLLAVTCSFWMCSNDATSIDEDNASNVKLKTFNSCSELGAVVEPFIEQKTVLKTIKINPELEPDFGEVVTAYNCKWELPVGPTGSLSDGETSVLGTPKTVIGNHTKQSYIDFLETPPAQLENVDEFHIFEDERIPDNVLIWKWLNNDQYGYLARLGYEMLIFDKGQWPYASSIKILMENRFGPNVQSAPFVPSDPGDDVALDIMLALIEIN